MVSSRTYNIYSTLIMNSYLNIVLLIVIYTLTPSERIYYYEEEKRIAWNWLTRCEKIVEKHNGVLTISISENIFCVKLIMYLMED